MAELRTVNPLVAGSSPALGAMKYFFNKFKNVFNTVNDSFSQDVTVQDLNTSKFDFYAQILKTNHIDTITYFVSYKGYSNTTNWGPFVSFETAKQWVDDLYTKYQIQSDIIFSYHPKSNPTLWQHNL